MLLSYREALNQAMREEMRRDSRIFLIGEEVGYYQGAFKVTKGFVEEFGPHRVVDTPITEAGFTGLAIGAAMAGLRPIVELMTMNFGIVALDQIVNNAAKIRYMSGGQLSVPMVIRGPGSAAHQLGAQHSQSLEAWFCHVPGLKVVAPSTPHDAKGLLKSAIRDQNPVIFIEAQLLYGTKGEVAEGEYTIPLGRADVKRAGTDVTVVAYSKMLLVALEAAERLRQDGLDVEVIDPRTLKPLDLESIVTSVKKTGRMVIVEEGWRFCGLGAQIADSVYAAAFDYLDAPIVRVTGEDVPMPYSRPLEDAAIPDVPRVVAAIHSLCGVA
ncbi:MAG: pyruvate dehydrogenase complex E1 component subunit beta [Nitrospira sp.]|uniref:Pyruvate dehydrogenase E1 component subunit beta n=1 Tax=Nitrospira defluvii TaxID=330214 RepID=A0ABM8RNA6_9BACT|nr:pyruvate dehydrogenase complex E1 component subunit beta [Nitrospira defluvii]MCS6326595.1 pyruvate dehydrogenase complex E1 component subunit beta [Nitrospira sp.]CAE6762460.1 Pyruvate dehydrogenase E1 component subunit beta [Nitrospira defluvii]